MNDTTSARSYRRTIARLAVVGVCTGQLLLALPFVTTSAYADGNQPDSQPNGGCPDGHYYCWSNDEQSAVCTTRACY